MARRSAATIAALVLLVVPTAALLAAVHRERSGPVSPPRLAVVSPTRQVSGAKSRRGIGSRAASRPRSAASPSAGPSAEQVARAFFESYLAFSYGRPGAHIVGATTGLRTQIESERPDVPQTVSGLTPEVTQLTLGATPSGQITALAAVSDGAGRYTLLATVARRGGSVVVSRFQPWG